MMLDVGAVTDVHKLTAKTGEAMVRVPHMARGFHCCPRSFVFVLSNLGLCILKNTCIYTHI
jgi:hypothetical protein